MECSASATGRRAIASRRSERWCSRVGTYGECDVGSLDSEAGIFASTFDLTGTRLITCEADKSIKVWREDEEATPESHPIDMEKWKVEWRAKRRFFWSVCYKQERVQLEEEVRVVREGRGRGVVWCCIVYCCIVCLSV